MYTLHVKGHVAVRQRRGCHAGRVAEPEMPCPQKGCLLAVRAECASAGAAGKRPDQYYPL